MAKKKVNVLKKQQKTKEKVDPRIEEIYEQEVEFTCPIRGKVKQIVKIKRYKPVGLDDKHVLLADNAIDQLEEKDNGLSIYTEADLESED